MYARRFYISPDADTASSVGSEWDSDQGLTGCGGDGLGPAGPSGSDEALSPEEPCVRAAAGVGGASGKSPSSSCEAPASVLLPSPPVWPPS